MLTLVQKIFNKQLTNNDQGFSLIEILVSLVLAALIFLAIPSSDNTQRHRNLKSAIDDINRSIRFAGNEAVLRNTVTRLRISLDKEPVEYTVEYGPTGNFPLPELVESENRSLEEVKIDEEKRAGVDKQFTTVEEFEDIKHAIAEDVTILGLATTSQKGLLTEDKANIYFYPTGEKDGALIIFSTTDEIAYIELAPFLSETNTFFEPLSTSSVAKQEDILQTRMEEVYKKWLGK